MTKHVFISDALEKAVEAQLPLCTSSGHFRKYSSRAGGYDVRTLSTAEAYDPDQNVWTMISGLTMPRSRHGICAVDNKLFVVGG